MLNNPTKLIFFLTLISGTMIAISANSWFGAWMGLEINLLSFIPLMSDSKNMLSTEASLKYFLTQALASATLLFTIILTALIYNTDTSLLINNTFIIILTSSTLLLKMGAAPFHFWFPGVMEGLNWMNGLVLMTTQKIAPLILLSYNLKMDLFTVVIISLSIILGSLGGLNQTSLRKILAYSSINHLGWMIGAMAVSETLCTMYFLIYSFLSMTIIFMLETFKLSHINQIFSFSYLTPETKFMLFMTFLSLGGLPPFLGFFPKWMVIQSMTENGMITLVVIMVMTTLLTLFYYLRTSFGAFMLTHAEPIWNTQIYPPSNLNLLSLSFALVSMLGLPLCTIWFTLL